MPRSPHRQSQPPAAAPSPAGESRAAVLRRLTERNALLEAVLDTLPLWISVKDRDGRYRLVNRALVEGHAARPEDFLGRHTMQSRELKEGGLQAMAELDAQVLATGTPAERPRYTVRLPDGRQRQRRLAKLPLHDAQGRVTGVLGWSEDITDAVMAEDALEAHRQLLRAVIDVVPHAISFIDAELRLQMVNPAWCALFDCAPDAMLGRTILEWGPLPSPVRERLYADNLAIVRGGEVPAPREYTIPTADGSEHVLMIAKAPVRGPHARLEGIVTVAADVTPLKRAEAQAELARARLADAVESLPAAFYLYDADERLVLANSTAAQYYPAEGAILRPGTPYSEVVRAGLSDLRSEPVDTDFRFRRALQNFRHPPESFEQNLRDGRIMLGRNRRTHDGGTVSIRYDITEQKRIQAELERRDQQTNAELELAAEVQRAILRPVQPPRFIRVGQRFLPSGPVSGDVYHARREADSFQCFVGDATGHGVGAAFMSILVEAGLSALPGCPEPDVVLDTLNGQLLGYELGGRFVSGICLHISADGQLASANAGHPPLIVLPSGGRRAVLLENGGLPLGWFAHEGYVAYQRQLAPGDKVLVYTDGLVEWGSPAGRELGVAALARLAWRHRELSAARLAARLVQEARRHAGNVDPTDDVTLFVFEFRGVPRRGGRAG